ncbi:MAG: GFA family protein [Gammaproteobacteria bacterium]|nr:GFA family protein [Gammaproteobacteria bacterium]
MDNINGQCRCGAVEYRATGGIKGLVNCHCELCRSINGSAFSSYVVVALEGLSVGKGRERVSRYQVTDGAVKHYCSTCGTPLFNTNPVRYPGLAMLYLGAVRNHPVLAAPINIYSESKLSWVDAIAEAQNFPGPPQRGT